MSTEKNDHTETPEYSPRPLVIKIPAGQEVRLVSDGEISLEVAEGVPNSPMSDAQFIYDALDEPDPDTNENSQDDE